MESGGRSIPACAGEPGGLADPLAQVRVYPRVCGGTSSQNRAGLRHRGLSPRVRGNPTDYLAGYAAGRSIPACAGEPVDRLPGQFELRVYPRVCGGTGSALSWSRYCGGLSPRVRGNRQHPGAQRAQPRSIPACAGEPPFPPPGCPPGRVYPRVCGGTAALRNCHQLFSGLSPRVRGNRHCVPPRGGWGGSIPACAGEPDCPVSHRADTRVYPRVCGGTPEPPTAAGS